MVSTVFGTGQKLSLSSHCVGVASHCYNRLGGGPRTPNAMHYVYEFTHHLLDPLASNSPILAPFLVTS